MTNKWVEFVRKWAKKHRQSYMCAASKQKCREEYHAAYPKKGSSTRKSLSPTTRKTRKNKTRMQRELLKKFKPYAKHRKNKGLPVE
jgi:hypothetical protein